jgi:hypothetical protein
MVICKCLTVMRAVAPIQVVAVHIDYRNRADSGDEAAFLEEW